MMILDTIIKFILCHLVGDYVLQTDFIAKTKGTNWYHLFIHCALYILPFYIVFGLDWRMAVLFITHIIIDPLKARWNKIDYITDQILHYLCVIIYFF
jgi:hypothetical protein